MTCDSCARAQADPRTGLYSRGCVECDTRALAHGLAYHAWVARGRSAQSLPREYAAALELIRREGETIRQAHARVEAWAQRIRSAK